MLRRWKGKWWSSLSVSEIVLVDRRIRYVLFVLPMKLTIVVLVRGKVRRSHLQYRSNPMKAKQATMSMFVVEQGDVLTVSKWMRSWFGCTGGADACRLVSVRKTILSCTSLRKLIRSYSRRSCNATWREMISFRWTPLKSNQERWIRAQEEHADDYMMGILKPSHSERLLRYCA